MTLVENSMSDSGIAPLIDEVLTMVERFEEVESDEVQS